MGLHSDQGTDCNIIGKAVTSWASDNGTTVTHSCAYLPGQNPFAENGVKIAKHMMEAARHSGDGGVKYWAHAFSPCCVHIHALAESRKLT